MIVVCFLLLAAVVLLFVFLYREKQYLDFVNMYSVTLKNLDKLNEKTHFKEIGNCDEKHTYDNEKMYESINCVDYLTYKLQFKQYNVLKEINKANSNKKMLEEYNNSIEKIEKFGIFAIPVGNFKKNKLLKIEKELFNKKKLQPIIEFNINIELFCATINGHIYKTRTESFDSEQIEAIIKRLNNKSNGFYRDKEIWNSICRVERGRVTNKMRFSIYKRDGYRCCICGKSGQFTDLEIDHKKPIAKGGKSTYDNLQTLCHRCNQEKGDKY